MPLMKCPDCGTEISTQAKACPKCGRVQKRPSAIGRAFKRIGMVALVLVGVFIVFGWFANRPEKQSATPLNAEVSVSGLDFKVENQDSFDWSHCILRVNIISAEIPGYRLDVDTIPAGQTVTLDGFKFRAGINGGGEPLDPLLRLNMGIRCDTPKGQATYVKIFK